MVLTVDKALSRGQGALSTPPPPQGQPPRVDYNTGVQAEPRLGRYRLGDRLGEGGMAEVYRAFDDGPGGFTKPVAVKLIRPVLANDSAMVEMFLAEARLAQRLHHGNIVQVLGLDLQQGKPYLVMEYVDGMSLSELVKSVRASGSRLGVDDALFVVEQVASALHYAHRLTDDDGRSTAVVHRDVNTRNVLVSREGIVKLTDFGIAKALHSPSMTLPGQVKGTIGCMSPEQARGNPIDAKTDLWATGVLLYELLTLDNPLTRVGNIDEYIDLLEKGLPRLRAEPPVDDELADIVAGATSVDPRDRYASMADFRAELEAWRVRRGIRTSPDRLRELARQASGRGKVVKPARLDNAVLAQLGGAELRETESLRGRKEPTEAASPDTGTRRRARWGMVLTIAAVAGGAGLALVALGGRDAARVGEGRAVLADAGVAVAVPAIPPMVDAAPRVAVLPETHVALSGPSEADRGKSASSARRPARAVGGRAAQSDAGGTAPRAREPRATDAALGALHVNTLPYAVVSIDGRARGKTPLQISLPAGSHVIELHNPDTGQRASKKVEVASGQTVQITRW